MMYANKVSEITGGERSIQFDRISVNRHCAAFDFDTLTATFEEV